VFDEQVFDEHCLDVSFAGHSPANGMPGVGHKLGNPRRKPRDNNALRARRDGNDRPRPTDADQRAMG